MKRIIILFLIAMLAVVGLAACGGAASESRSKAVTKKETEAVESALARLEKVEPTPTLYDSADRAIQRAFYTAEADPNKIWYLETLSFAGSVEASYTIRGPVESEDDELTNPLKKECESWGKENAGGGCVATALAESNGIYEHQTNDHIAILADGALLRFEGNYQTSDQPFTVKTPETISVNSNAAISSTNLNDSANGFVPKR